MSKSKVFGIITLAMVLVAVVFTVYAMNHPEASFPWSSSITHAIYGIYGVLNGIMCGLTFYYRKK